MKKIVIYINKLLMCIVNFELVYLNSKYTTNESLDSMKQVETNSKLEQDKLSTTFNIVCEKLCEMKTAFSDLKNAINCDIFHV